MANPESTAKSSINWGAGVTVQYVAGCKALGLGNKVVSGSLWCVLES